MIKIFGKEFKGQYFEKWNLRYSLRTNSNFRIKNSLYICDRKLEAEFITRCISGFNEDEMELLKLKEHLRSIEEQKKCVIRQAEHELEDVKETLEIIDDAINTLLRKQAWAIGYKGAEEDFKNAHPSIKKRKAITV